MKKCRIITIARKYASGGRAIGQLLADRLNVPIYDKELIAMAAKKSGMSEEVFHNADERATSSLLYSLVMGTFSFGTVPAAGDMPINDKLFLIQSDIIKKAAEDGPCIIVGRCADYILRDRDDVLHVFVNANRETRKKRAIEFYGVDPAKVEDTLNRKDKQRGNYYSFYTNKRWDDVSNYNLTLDSSFFGLEKSADLILAAAEAME